MALPFSPAPRSKHLTGVARRTAIASDKCPECEDGELDTGWECVDCGFDAQEEALAIPEMSTAGRSSNDPIN
jgi:Zn ribbon nucleic-acid-binding protein